jgi:hypothetical protein
MTDLVKRLRSLGSAGPGCISFLASEDAMKAADRIEKLEAALRKIKDLHHTGGIEDLQERDDMTYKIVCDTLEGKDG